MTLMETVRSRDEALSGTGQEIEPLRVTIHDRDEVLQVAEKAHELRDQIMGWQTHDEGRFPPDSNLDLGFLCVG
jgi:hypothetical protein